jgi:hypothetical protein
MLKGMAAQLPILTVSAPADAVSDWLPRGGWPKVAATVIRVMALYDRSGFMPQGSSAPLQLRSVASTEASKHWLLTCVGRPRLR